MSVCLLFPAELLDVFDERNWSWGFLNLRIDDAQGVVTVIQARHGKTDEVQRLSRSDPLEDAPEHVRADFPEWAVPMLKDKSSM